MSTTIPKSFFLQKLRFLLTRRDISETTGMKASYLVSSLDWDNESSSGLKIARIWSHPQINIKYLKPVPGSWVFSDSWDSFCRTGSNRLEKLNCINPGIRWMAMLTSTLLYQRRHAQLATALGRFMAMEGLPFTNVGRTASEMSLWLLGECAE